MKLSPSDLDKYSTVESTRKIRIDELVKEANKRLKEELIRSSISVLGLNIELITTMTRFGGKKYWFKCPECQHRRGTLFLEEITHRVGCRDCLKLRYVRQSYKF